MLRRVFGRHRGQKHLTGVIDSYPQQPARPPACLTTVLSPPVRGRLQRSLAVLFSPVLYAAILIAVT